HDYAHFIISGEHPTLCRFCFAGTDFNQLFAPDINGLNPLPVTCPAALHLILFKCNILLFIT
ncbi:hypothetical protein ABH309_19490, partial [Chromobacterium piscinae]